uniref:Dynein regulatory complex protein 9 n=1 Tax=Leptobrachium leishanense TaxID=445787 RepID=A0A8C5QPK2_9ANUR
MTSNRPVPALGHPQKMTSFPMMDMISVCTVLEDSLDQLSILGYIINPAPYSTHKNVQWPLISDNLKKIQAENIKKVHSDRQYAEDVIMGMLNELEDSGSFLSLLQAVEMEKERKDHFHRAIESEKEGRNKTELLQKQLDDIKKEKEVELQNCNELIAHLKDQLQEMIAKTNMDIKYAKKDTDLQIYQTQKKCSISESNLQQNLKSIQNKIDEEIRTHTELENYQRQYLQELEVKLEHWMEKYDKDVDQKEKEIKNMKAARDKDLALLQTLAEQYKEHERVIIEDRLEKEKARQEKRQAQLELKSTIKIQAWWRGIMVRKGLGPYKRAKSKKGVPCIIN